MKGFGGRVTPPSGARVSRSHFDHRRLNHALGKCSLFRRHQFLGCFQRRREAFIIHFEFFELRNLCVNARASASKPLLERSRSLTVRDEI